MLNNLPAAVAAFDRELRYLHCNPRWREELEGGRDDVAGRCYYEVHPDMPAYWREVHDQVLAGATLRNDSEYFLLADGQEFWTRWICQPWYYAAGEIGGLIVMLDNQTPWRQATLELRTSQERLHLALDSARAGTWEADIASGRNTWSAEIWPLYGLTPGQVEPSTETWRDTVDPAQQEEVVRRITEAVTRQETFEAEWRVHCPGPERWLFSRGRPVLGEDGRAERYIGVVIDISEKKRAEEALAGRERELRAILDALPMMLAWLDRDLRYRFANTAYARLAGFSREDLIGRHLSEVIDADGYQRAAPYIRRALAGETARYENSVETHDGRRLHSLVTLVPERAADDAVLGFFAAVVDLSREKELALERERLNQQMEALTRHEVALQTMSAVAHELNQPLHAAASFCVAARHMLEQDYPVRSAVAPLERAREELGRAGAILKDLVGSIQEPQALADAAVFDLSKLAAAAMERFSRDQLPIRACVDGAFPSAPLWVAGNPIALEKVIANLLRNACSALRCGGECGGEGGGRSRVLLEVTRRDDHARLCVRDNGPGVAPEELQRLFQPVRGNGRVGGLGVGLAISRHLIELQGGRIWHEPAPGGGACFCFELPLTDPP